MFLLVVTKEATGASGWQRTSEQMKYMYTTTSVQFTSYLIGNNIAAIALLILNYD